MKHSNLNLAKTVVAAATLSCIGTAAHALDTTVVTFDNGVEGWHAQGVCEVVKPDDGNPGAHLNIASHPCDSDELILSGWFTLSNSKNPAFVGNFADKGPVRISVDVDVTDYTYYWFGSAVEEYRQVVFEFIDYDNPYTDPNTGYAWPYTSVIFAAGYLPARDAGWKTFTVEIADPTATALPAGWVGLGGPEDAFGFPQLPPGRTFADVMAGVDEIQIHNIEPGYYYDFGFVYDVKFDNITISELPKKCGNRTPTIWVNGDGIIQGGDFAGLSYRGQLRGTSGNDVIVGTDGSDRIEGLQGDDVICGLDGDDVLAGQSGDDYLDGGAGRDIINGGPGSNTCAAGEVVTACGRP
jgi:hypothetical protein